MYHFYFKSNDNSFTVARVKKERREKEKKKKGIPNAKSQLKTKITYLQAIRITNSSWSTITIISIFNQSRKKFVEIHIPDFLVYIDRISNRMQHLIWDQKSKKLFKLIVLSANKKNYDKSKPLHEINWNAKNNSCRINNPTYVKTKVFKRVGKLCLRVRLPNYVV